MALHANRAPTPSGLRGSLLQDTSGYRESQASRLVHHRGADEELDNLLVLLVEENDEGSRGLVLPLSRLGCAICHVTLEQAPTFLDQRYDLVVVQVAHDSQMLRTLLQDLREQDERCGRRTPVVGVLEREAYSLRRALTDQGTDEVLDPSPSQEDLRETLRLCAPRPDMSEMSDSPNWAA